MPNDQYDADFEPVDSEEDAPCESNAVSGLEPKDSEEILPSISNRKPENDTTPTTVAKADSKVASAEQKAESQDADEQQDKNEEAAEEMTEPKKEAAASRNAKPGKIEAGIEAGTVTLAPAVHDFFFSKPNLKLRRKMPAINPSDVNSRLEVEFSPNKHTTVANLSCTEPVAPSAASSSQSPPKKLNTTDLDPDFFRPKLVPLHLKKAKNKRSITGLRKKPPDSRASLATHSGDLLSRIEESLAQAETLLTRCDSRILVAGSEAQWKSLERENVHLRGQLKVLNGLLSALLMHKVQEVYKRRLRKDSVGHNYSQILGGEGDTENTGRRLKLYELEFDKLRKRVEQVADPQYGANLKATCKMLDTEAKQISGRKVKLELRRKLQVYVLLPRGEEVEIHKPVRRDGRGGGYHEGLQGDQRHGRQC